MTPYESDAVEPPVDGPVPTSIDWTKAGYVTAVRNQGACGSCWAFAAIASFEAGHMIAGRGNVDMSEQQAVDCDRSEQYIYSIHFYSEIKEKLINRGVKCNSKNLASSPI